jgi:hypothetical protein
LRDDDIHYHRVLIDDALAEAIEEQICLTPAQADSSIRPFHAKFHLYQVEESPQNFIGRQQAEPINFPPRQSAYLLFQIESNQTSGG